LQLENVRQFIAQGQLQRPSRSIVDGKTDFMFGIKSKARRQLAPSGDLASFRNRSEIAPTQAAQYDEK
jgi:hypothetical protein